MADAAKGVDLYKKDEDVFLNEELEDISEKCCWHQKRSVKVDGASIDQVNQTKQTVQVSGPTIEQIQDPQRERKNLKTRKKTSREIKPTRRQTEARVKSRHEDVTLGVDIV